MGMYVLDIVYCCNQRCKIIVNYWLDDDILKQPLFSVVKFCYLKHSEQLSIPPTNSPHLQNISKA